MKRRSFLQLLGTALGLGVLSRRAPAVEAVSAAPANSGVLTQAALDQVLAQLDSPEALDRATQFGREEGQRMLNEIAARPQTYYRRYPGAWTLDPATNEWTYTFDFGPDLFKMAQPNRRHGR